MTENPRLGPLAKAEGEKRAERAMADPSMRPAFQLGFIDGAVWGYWLALETMEKTEDEDQS